MTAKPHIPSLLVSLALHGAAIAVMGMVTYAVDPRDPLLVIETFIAEEDRTYDEVMQELDTQQEIAESINFVAGSIATDAAGETALASQQKLDPEQVLREPDFRIPPAIEDLPASETLAQDLGEEALTGEIGALVEGYGPALDRLTAELLRLLRSHKLTVVWLFDESESMKDDQQQLRDRLYRVYEELRLVETDPDAAGLVGSNRLKDVLESAVTSFGATWRFHTPKPTSDIRELMTAIDRIPIDRTGVENMCQALRQALDKYRGVTRRGRKLVLIVVSDESGDDGRGPLLEEIIKQAKTVRAPIYILGREAVFGARFAYKRWRHPDTKRVHYLPIRRGPETAFFEQLQYAVRRNYSFGPRDDSHMSGFGPYEQVRLCRETGGIFFQLLHEEENLHDFDDRKNQALNLREYVPDLESRRVYLEKRSRSPFRSTVAQVIATLDPNDQERAEVLRIPNSGWYRRDPARYMKPAKERFEKIMNVLRILTAAQGELEKVRGLRSREPSLRWRANFDLLYAQLFGYRVRLLEYAIALDRYAQSVPKRKFKNPKANRWSVRMGSKRLVMPTEQQQDQISKLLGTEFTAEDLKQAHQRALELLAKVQEEHPGTPWARRAEWELSRQFGASFGEHVYTPPPPRKPGQKPKPKPFPPPKL